MLIIGLTGSIGMGKTETAKMFTRLGVPVYDADAAVHRLYAKGGKAVPSIEAAHPGVTKDGAIDRQELAKRVLNDHDALRKIEAIVHPLVGEEQMLFLEQAEADGEEIVVLDIPLIFEGSGTKGFDAIVVVSAPYELQRDRVLERPGMTAEKFASILEKQVPDEEKRKRADYVVESDKGLEAAFEQVKAIVDDLKGRPGVVWAVRKAQRQKST